MLTVTKSAPTVQTVEFINTLEVDSPDAIALLILLKKGDAEKLVDILLENDRFCTVVRAIRSRFPGWQFVESWNVVEDDERGSGRAWFYVPF